MKLKFFALIFVLSFVFLELGTARAEEDPLTGLYKGAFLREGSKFFNWGEVLVQSLGTGGNIKYKANVKIYFGEWNSDEFFIYDFDYDQCKLLKLFNQFSCSSDKNDVSIVVDQIDEERGVFKGAKWYSKLAGFLGAFEGIKKEEPKAPTDGVLVRPLSGYFRGVLENLHPDFSLPKGVALSLVATQDVFAPEPKLIITGVIRLYKGSFLGPLYYEFKLKEPQWNAYKRFLSFSAENPEMGTLNLKGYMANDGVFKSSVLMEGFGQVVKVEVKPYP